MLHRSSLRAAALSAAAALLAVASPAAEPALAYPHAGPELSVVVGDAYSGLGLLTAQRTSSTLFVAYAPGSERELTIATKSSRTGVTTVVNTANARGRMREGLAAETPLTGVTGMATNGRWADPYEGDSQFYVADAQSHRVGSVPFPYRPVLSFVAGNGTTGAVVPGPALQTPLTPGALAAGPDRDLYIADLTTGVVAKVHNNQLTIAAGTGTRGTPTPGDRTPATTSPFDSITGLALDTQGTLYIADGPSACVTRLDRATGGLSLVAGQCGSPGRPVPGVATASPLGELGQIDVDATGDVYIADTGNHVVLKVDPATDTLRIIAGTGVAGATRSGRATQTPVTPRGLAVDPVGTVYLAQDGAAGLATIARDPSLPGEPRDLEASRFKDDLSQAADCLRLWVRPPVDNGTLMIDHYEASVDGATWRSFATPRMTTHVRDYDWYHTLTLCGLSRDRAYTLQVRAVSRLGPGASGRVTLAPLPGPLAPRPPLTPPAPSAWFADPLSPAARARLVVIPRKASTYRGKPLHTRALHRAYRDQIAVPVDSVRGRALAAGQAALLSGGTLFRYNSARLTANGQAQIRALATSMDGAQSIVCEGYTDYGGSITREKRLSLDRARGVCAALKANGVTAAMTSLGYGEQRPVIIGGKAAPRAENRRVVVLFRS